MSQPCGRYFKVEWEASVQAPGEVVLSANWAEVEEVEM